MAKKPAPKNNTNSNASKKKGKHNSSKKQPTQKNAMERVMVLKANGKRTFVWREWGS